MAMYYTPIPHEFLEEMGELSDAEYGRLIRWCQTYSITGEEIELSGNERFFRMRCKKQIDKINSHYEEIAAKNRANGAKGGRPKKNQEKAEETQNNPTVFEETQQNPEETKRNPKNQIKTKTINKKEDEVLMSNDINTMSDSHGDSDIEKVVSAWNSMAGLCGVPRVTKVLPDSARGKLLKKRIRDYGVDSVLSAIDNIAASDFLTGHGNRGWTISFDWFIKPNNFSKVLDGNYANRASPETTKGKVEQVAEWTRELEAKYEAG